MNQPCDVKALCFDPATPVTNFSSEAPDQDLFIGYSWGYGPFKPRLGSAFTAQGCNTICEAADPVDALLCAAESWLACAAAAWPQADPPIDPSSGRPTSPPMQLFFNSLTTAIGTCPDGLSFFVSVAAGRFSAFSQVLADRMAFSYAQQLLFINSVCMTSLSPSEAGVGGAYSGLIRATGRNVPFTFTLVSGSLPPGLTFSTSDPNTASITGTPTATGTYSFTIQAVDSLGDFMRKTFSISVFEITTVSPLTDGQKNAAYSVTFSLSGTPSGIVTWSLTSGSLPDGLTLSSSTGTLSGTPTTVQDATFTIQASDGIMTTKKAFSIHVAVPVTCLSKGVTVGAGTFPLQSAIAASRSSLYHRLVYGEGGNLHFVNTDSDSIIATIAASFNQNGLGTSRFSFAPSSAKFFIPAANGKTINVFTSEGVNTGLSVIVTAAGADSAANCCYSASVDRVFASYYKSSESLLHLMSIQPSTLIPTDLTTTLNLTPGFVNGCLPGFVLFVDPANNDIYVLVASTGVLYGTIHLATFTGGLEYAANTGKLYVGQTVAGVQFVAEVDPLSLLVVFTYTLTGSANSTYISYEPNSGALFTPGAVIDPTKRTVFCNYSPITNRGLEVDSFSGKAYQSTTSGGGGVFVYNPV